MGPNPPPPALPADDPLINGHGIELVPQYTEHEPNPGPEVQKHSSLEVRQDSTLEVASPRPVFQSHTHSGPGSAALDIAKLISWEKLLGKTATVAGPAPLRRPYTAISTTSALSSPAPLSGYPADGAASVDGTGAGTGGDGGNHKRYSDSSFRSPFDQRPLVPTPGTGGKGARLCGGVTRQMFWALLAVGVFLLVAAVAMGVGLGLGLSGRKEESTSPTESPSTTRTLPLPVATSTLSPVPVLSPTSFPSPTNPSSSSSSPSSPPPPPTYSYPPIPCPSSNLTLFAPSAAARGNPDRRYLLLCGRDYHAAQGTMDMYSAPTGSLGECIDLCAAQEGCVGAGWGGGGREGDATAAAEEEEEEEGGEETRARAICWLKSRLGGWHESEGWAFVVLDEGG